jgi:hypothetical protein
MAAVNKFISNRLVFHNCALKPMFHSLLVYFPKFQNVNSNLPQLYIYKKIITTKPNNKNKLSTHL